MNYNNYTAEDLLLDDTFISYLENRNVEDCEKWKKIVDGQHIDQQVLQEAKTIYHGLMQSKIELKEEEVQVKIQDVNRQLFAKSKAVRFPNWAKIAAAFLILTATIAFLTQRSWEPVITNTTEEITTNMLEKEVPFGQKRTVYFSDGSKVKLNSGSKIRYSERFSDKLREVELEGEGFFEVVKDPKRPFIVATHEVKTTVLGTSFNVNSYPESDFYKVTVATGKVGVYTDLDPKGLYILPNQQASYSLALQTIEKVDAVSLEDVLAWKNGVLLFKDADWKEVVQKIERWYGVQISIKLESKREIKYSARFENNMALEEVLKKMQYTLQFGYKIANKNVSIY